MSTIVEDSILRLIADPDKCFGIFTQKDGNKFEEELQNSEMATRAPFYSFPGRAKTRQATKLRIQFARNY